MEHNLMFISNDDKNIFYRLKLRVEKFRHWQLESNNEGLVSIVK